MAAPSALSNRSTQVPTPAGMPTASIGKADLARLAASEWVLTNGLGGFAMGTAGGVPERRYHAWLVGATTPPVGRVVGLHSCVEWLVLDEGRSDVPSSSPSSPGSKPIRLELTSLRYGDGTISPRGLDALERFELQAGATATWEYAFTNELGSLAVTRSLLVPREKNAVVVRYSVRWMGSPLNARSSADRGGRASAAGHLEIRPLIALRDFHQLRANLSPADRFDVRRIPADNGCVVTYSGPDGIQGQPVTVCAWGTLGRCFFREDAESWRNVHAMKDQARGQDCVDTLFSPGVLSLPIGGPASSSAQGNAGEVRLELRAHLGGTEHQPDGFETELVRLNSRRTGLINDVLRVSDGGGDQPLLSALAVAADQFVVRREIAVPGERRGTTSLSSVIAGYPWFSDWGRDTFIAMPGLFFATGRMGEAFDTLAAFAGLIKDGLVPNCFDDGSGHAWYNTVDASLWFVHAACEFLRRSDDRPAFDSALAPACLAVMQAYQRGTQYNIGMDPADGLVAAGDETTQLTWMDAKRNGVVFTPRHGKAVEINALWYSALRELAASLGPAHPKSAEFVQLSDKVAASFREKFWNPANSCLFDVLSREPGKAGIWLPIADIRPNQIFAVSLPHSPLTSAQQRSVVACVRDRLLTPLGLRTLDPAHPKYTPRFEGDLMKRDGAYHNGTVWPWLLGPYCSAVLRVGNFNPASRAEVRSLLTPLATQLTGPWTRPSSILTLTEVYDADEPRRPDGCMAQAWSVAELLRVLLAVHAKA